ncbi:hypothetical protein JHN46_19205 [Streptomyces sp. MBT33]|nr:hypothetical protein [Streptomyces sp. MBT33]
MAGDGQAAERLALQAANRGNIHALLRLASLREETGDGQAAERLALQAANRGNTAVLFRLASLREEAGDREAAERLALQAANRGNNSHPEMTLLGKLWPYGLDPDGTPSPPWEPLGPSCS